MNTLVLSTIALFCLGSVATEEKTVPTLDGFVYLGLAPPTVTRDGATIQLRYWRSTSSKTWDAAYASCRNQGGHLVSPRNPALDDDLRNHLFMDNFGASIWLGAKQSGSVWTWFAYNTEVGYTNWASASCGASGTNRCAYATGASGTDYSWCSSSCSTLYHYVCEA